MTKRTPKVIPISRCIKRSWKFQDFKITGHPYWELWNEILHAVETKIEIKNSNKQINSVNSINSAPKTKESNRNDNG